jgi:secreted trypsin-like serine protease
LLKMLLNTPNNYGCIMPRVIFVYLSGLLAISLVFASCGDSSNLNLKIIGGQAVTAKDPLAGSVALLLDANNRLQCTVVALEASVFLTAGHCVYARSLVGWHIQTGLEIGSGETFEIASTAVHGEYSPASMFSLDPERPANDIALLRTVTPWSTAVYVQLLTPDTRASLALPLDLKVVGYGRTIGNTSSSNGTLNWGQVSANQENTRNHEFLSEQSDGVMGCHGDSGGPAFKIDSGNLLVGIVSRGDSDCTSGTTVYTDVSAFSEFLKSTSSN